MWMCGICNAYEWSAMQKNVKKPKQQYVESKNSLLTKTLTM